MPIHFLFPGTPPQQQQLAIYWNIFLGIHLSINYCEAFFVFGFHQRSRYGDPDKIWNLPWSSPLNWVEIFLLKTKLSPFRTSVVLVLSRSKALNMNATILHPSSLLILFWALFSLSPEFCKTRNWKRNPDL